MTVNNHASNIVKVDFLKAEGSAITRAQDNVALPQRVILGDITNELAGLGHTLPKSGNALIQTSLAKTSEIADVGDLFLHGYRTSTRTSGHS